MTGRRMGFVIGVILLAYLVSLFVSIYSSFKEATRKSTAVEMRHLIQRACSGKSNTTYSGTVSTTMIFCGRDYRTASTIRHRGNLERIDYNNGAVMISAADATRTYSPDTKTVTVSSPSVESKSASNLDLLLKNYELVSRGTDRVAGRETLVVELRPTRPGGPSKRLWLYPATDTILKMEDRTSSGKLKSRTEFTSIDFSKSIPDSAFQSAACGGSSCATVKECGPRGEAVDQAVGIKPSFPKYLPQGYVMDGVSVYHCACKCGHKAIHIRYTDGLNSISVYETPAKLACGDMCKIHCPSGGKCEVSDADQSQVATASISGRSIVVVSDLPKNEISRIAESIK